MMAVTRFILPLTVLALCLFLRAAFTRASMSSKVSSFFFSGDNVALALALSPGRARAGGTH